MPIGPIRGLVHGPLLAHEYDFTVPRFVVDNQRWDFTPLSMVLPDMVIQHILAQPLPLNVTHIRSNIQTWNNHSGICSVKSAYLFLLDKRSQYQNRVGHSWGWVWKLRLPPKIQLFIWKCAHNQILTRSIIFSHLDQVNTRCPRCMEMETPIHVIRDCAFAKNIGMSFPTDFLFPKFFTLNLHQWCKKNTKVNDLLGYVSWGVIFAFVLRAIWLDRNSLIFSNHSIPSQVL